MFFFCLYVRFHNFLVFWISLSRSRLSGYQESWTTFSFLFDDGYVTFKLQSVGIRKQSRIAAFVSFLIIVIIGLNVTPKMPMSSILGQLRASWLNQKQERFFRFRFYCARALKFNNGFGMRRESILCEFCWLTFRSPPDLSWFMVLTSKIAKMSIKWDFSIYAPRIGGY